MRASPFAYFDIYFEPDASGVSAWLGIEKTTGEWRDQVQLLIMSLFTARMIANLRTKGYGWRIAEYLSDPLGGMASLPPIDWVSHPAGGGTKGFSSSVGFGREVQHLRDVMLQRVPVFFDLKAIGFGLLGRDVGEYSLRAVDAAFVGAHMDRKDDTVFRTALIEMASALGGSARAGEITARRQVLIAVVAAAMGWAIARGENWTNHLASGYD